jgi:undecaprenyl-diphosphatase
MEWWQALVLGVVEGVTEYLPVSSTGHLILAQRLMGIPGGEAADAYAICIQAGAIVAVLGLYFRHVREMGLGLLGRNPAGLRLALNIGAAFVPAAVLGLLLEKQIKAHLFGLWPVVAAWLVGGLVILAVAWRSGKGAQGRGRGVKELTLAAAVAIGLFQCLGMWPGTSRSLVTILGGLAVGLTLPAAVEFSFLLGVVTLLAATAHDALKHGGAMLGAYSWPSLAVGFVAAALTAAAAVAWMVHYLRRHGLAVFGYYRIALGLAVAALLVLGSLDPQTGHEQARSPQRDSPQTSAAPKRSARAS